MALIHKLLVFTAVWNCFVTLVFRDGENEKSISAAASIVEVFFCFSFEKTTEFKMLSILWVPVRAGCSTAIMNHTVMHQ